MSTATSGPIAELAFMPWVRVSDPVKVGPVTFFDYPASELPVTIGAGDRARLDRLKSAYRSWPEQDEIETIVVAAVDAAAPLRPLTGEERQLVRRAGFALAFACLGYGYHRSFGACSSDNFLLYHQNFDGSNSMAVETGRRIVGYSDSRH